MPIPGLSILLMRNGHSHTKTLKHGGVSERPAILTHIRRKRSKAVAQTALIDLIEGSHPSAGASGG